MRAHFKACEGTYQELEIIHYKDVHGSDRVLELVNVLDPRRGRSWIGP